jgi:acetyltransferase-like isoleucine patch superfamily enzyme
VFVVYPLWQVARYVLFFSLLLFFLEIVPGERDAGGFFVTYFAFHIIWSTLTPLVFVAIKWIVIGRYRPGRYRIWGIYYLRWWFVDICRKLFMRGVFRSSDSLLNFYYRLLGAKIGRGARISPECEIAEFDLVEIGDEAIVDAGVLRGFGVDNGGMILGSVRVGNRSGLGIKALVAPRTEVPDNAHLGPATSSYDDGPALDEKHSLVNRKSIPDPNVLMHFLVVTPILSLVNAVGQIPPLAVLYLMVQFKGEEGDFDNMYTLIQWLLAPQRIPYFIGIRVARALLSPLFYMMAAILVKRVIIGKFKAGPLEASSQWELVRHKLASRLLSRTRIQHVTDIIGRHYELVSILYRLLGAKVGKRVFWPGHQPQFTGQFDLLEIGDDVVFGSRCAILLATKDSCEKVILCAGSNVSDNNVVLPGSIIGKKAVLGSNSVCPRGWYLPEESVWFGSKGCEPRCLEKGVEAELAGPVMASELKRDTLQMTGDETTFSPFAKAFCLRRAPYFVWPLWMIVLYTVIMKAIIASFHAFPLLGAIHGAAVLLYGVPISDRDYTAYGPLPICIAFLYVYFVTNAARVFIWLVSEVAAKQMIMGRRQPGRYNYDEVNYGQRWELYQIFSKMRSFSRLNILDFFSGTPVLAFYFRLLGSNIGSDVCLYPSGADPFMPEPDLVTIGPRTVVDCSSLVCHLNTRGNFVLGKIVIENDCTLRARSRLQQGVIMEEGSQILEKSVAMTGEVLESFSVWQGTPATEWFQYPKSDESTVDDSQQET